MVTLRAPETNGTIKCEGEPSVTTQLDSYLMSNFTTCFGLAGHPHIQVFVKVRY
jgi:hypothetical protein